VITPQTVQRILDAARVEDVVGDFVTLKRRGTNFTGLCPFHNEKTPSFSVSPNKGIYKCFGCGKGGDSVGFVMEHENCSYPEALKWLANKYKIEIEQVEYSKEVKDEKLRLDGLYLTNEFAQKYYTEQLWETDYGKSIGLNYFKNRGLREETIRIFGLGFAPEGHNTFTNFAKSKSYTQEQLLQAGVTRTDGRDFFRNRVLFPIHNVSGRVVGFGGRVMSSEIQPKYLNTGETEIYNKSKLLYGIFFAKKAIRQLDECILTEGYLDVVSLFQAGIENVVASSGTSLTVDQIQLIKRHTPNVKILYDGDAAGIKAALRGLDLVLEQGLNVKVVLLPQGEDPDSYVQKLGSEAFKTFIDKEAKDFIIFKTKTLLKDADNDPIKRVKVLKDIIESIVKIPDPITRSVYIRECANLMQMSEAILVEEVNKLKTQALQKAKTEQIGRGDHKGTPQQPWSPQPNKGAPQPFSPDEMSAFDEQEIDENGNFVVRKTSLEKGDHEGTPQPPQTNEALIGEAYQERAVIRVLMLFGDKVLASGIVVSHLIVMTMQDSLDEFDDALCKQILIECTQKAQNEEVITPQFFTTHADKAVRDLAIHFLSYDEQFGYSENWLNKLDLPLNTQPPPDENFETDTLHVVRHLRFRKIVRLLEKNKIAIKNTPPDDDNFMILLHLQQKLLTARKELTEALNIQGAM
jgi:DNA primase